MHFSKPKNLQFGECSIANNFKIVFKMAPISQLFKQHADQLGKIVKHIFNYLKINIADINFNLKYLNSH